MQVYHRKGEKVARMMGAGQSKADKAWYKSWWTARVEEVRKKIEEAKGEGDLVHALNLSAILEADLKHASVYGVK